MMRKFYKMHGTGNDYVYFDCFEEEIANPALTAVRLSDRHFSIGGDGIVLICKSEVADGKMRMFNADGSEGKMCGNAIRCVGKFLYEVKGVKKNPLTVETLSGIKTLYLTTEGERVTSVTVNMGKAELNPAKIPANFKGERAIAVPLKVAGQDYTVSCVSMGNPHCIVFQDPYATELEKIGPCFENHEAFPERVNTEFILPIQRNELLMRVWERGSGETWACGTGACAAVVAAVENGYCDKDTDVTVHLRGGNLVIRYTDDAVFMSGAATLSFIGEVEL